MLNEVLTRVTHSHLMRTTNVPSFIRFIGAEEPQVLIVLCLIGAWTIVGYTPLPLFRKNLEETQ